MRSQVFRRQDKKCLKGYITQICRFEIPQCRTHYGKRIREFYVPDMFNSLPESVTQANSKRVLKKVN